MTAPGLQAAVTDAARRLRPPALAAAVVAPSGEAAVAATGVRVRGGTAAVTADDLWHLGSCGKAVTAALYARLVDAGAAAWGATLPDLLPAARAGMHPGWRQVTIDALLLHRAGVPSGLDPAAMRAAHDDPRPVAEQRAAAAAAALAAPPDRPGAFRYSNLGYVIAGAAIEALAGRPWEDAVRDELLGPLGIRSAGVGAPRGAQPWGHAPRRAGLGRGPAVAPESPDADGPPVMGPAGGLHMTLADWGRFVAQFLDGGASVLGDRAVERLLAPPPAGPAVAMGWAHPPRRGRGPLRGVGVGQQGSNRRWVATVFLAPDRRRAVLVAANDGRARMRGGTARLAADVLSAA